MDSPWPHYRPLHERWFMQELVDKAELAPIWRERMVPGENDSVFADHYPDRDAAIAAATALNPTLRAALSNRAMDPVAKRSLQLRVDKALQAKQRLQDEEALMLAEALRRHAGDEQALRFHPGPNGGRTEVEAVSSEAQTGAAETILALLIIVYRLRNNLFHGEKWSYYFKDQLGNFTHASAILMRTVELFAVKGLLTVPE